MSRDQKMIATLFSCFPEVDGLFCCPSQLIICKNIDTDETAVWYGWSDPYIENDLFYLSRAAYSSSSSSQFSSKAKTASSVLPNTPAISMAGLREGLYFPFSLTSDNAKPLQFLSCTMNRLFYFRFRRGGQQFRRRSGKLPALNTYEFHGKIRAGMLYCAQESHLHMT